VCAGAVDLVLVDGDLDNVGAGVCPHGAHGYLATYRSGP
jgi:hypothetical protein